MRFTLDHFNDDRAVLLSEDGQELVVPISELPDGASEGTVFNVRFGDTGTAAGAPSASAQDIVNEMLGGT